MTGNSTFLIKKNIFKLYARIATPIFKYLPIPQGIQLSGDMSMQKMVSEMAKRQLSRPVIITGQNFCKRKEFKLLTDALEAGGMNYRLFNEVTPDPDFTVVRKGIEACREHHYDSVIAIGGGSPMDAAKVINPCAKNGYTPEKCAGMFKIRKRGEFFTVIPTTAGTGSEATIVAIISDTKTHQKKQVISTAILPELVVLDPRLMLGIPPALTAATGMDALTHAIESYLSLFATPQSKEQSLSAIKPILEYLPQATGDGAGDLNVRKNMAEAAHTAGLAFTRASLGWVHALAHQLGAYYQMPHGLACAITLPHVLKMYAEKVPTAMTGLADQLKVDGYTDSEKARGVVRLISELCKTIKTVPNAAVLKEKDIPSIAQKALHECYTSPFAVPAYFDSMEEMHHMIRNIFNE